MINVNVLRMWPHLVWLLVSGLFYGTFAVEELKCERITVPACQNLGYNMTISAAPASNSTTEDNAGFKSQFDAEILITSLRQVIDSGCSKQARFLFCSSLVPLCSPNAPRPVLPCRSLCEQVKADCFSDAVFSKQWPSYLECKNLPQPEKQGLCMQVPVDYSITAEKNESSTLKPWPALKFSFPPGSISPGTQLNQLLPQGTPNQNQMSTISLCPTNYSVNYDHCVPKCGGSVDALYSQQQKENVEFWTLILSAICFIFTLMSLVTFWTRSSKFDYPERPIFFMTLCYNLLGLCYLERIILHNPKKEILDLAIEKQECIITSQCLAYYIIQNYFLISATMWWLIFGICWYLSTAKQWSCEALEKKSGLFHVLAWVVPFSPPISALLRGNVSKFELTGLCSAKGFTEIPALILLILGAIFVVLSLFALKKLKTTWNQSNALSEVFTRVLIFGTIYFIPALSAVICTFFEEVEVITETCITDVQCKTPERSSLLPTIIKLVLTLIGGSLTGIFIWSKQPCDLNKKPTSSFKTVPLIKQQQTAFNQSKKYNYHQAYLPSPLGYTPVRVHRARSVEPTYTITRI